MVIIIRTAELLWGDMTTRVIIISRVVRRFILWEEWWKMQITIKWSSLFMLLLIRTKTAVIIPPHNKLVTMLLQLLYTAGFSGVHRYKFFGIQLSQHRSVGWKRCFSFSSRIPFRRIPFIGKERQRKQSVQPRGTVPYFEINTRTDTSANERKQHCLAALSEGRSSGVFYAYYLMTSFHRCRFQQQWQATGLKQLLALVFLRISYTAGTH